MPRRIVFILGAGFSKPAGGPLLRDLLKPEWIEKSNLSLADDSSVRAVSPSFQGGGAEPGGSVEDLFTDVWIAARTRGRFRCPPNLEFDGEELLRTLQRHLSSLAAAVHLRRGSNLWLLYQDFFLKAYRRSRDLTIITFNYDLLTEQILDDAGLYFDLGGVPDIRIDSPTRKATLTRRGADVSLLKLHGSISWGICHGCSSAEESNDVATAFDDAYLPIHRRACSYCRSGLLDPGLVPPIQGKAGELTFKSELWGRARQVLSRASEVVVIGYSLPPTDREAHSLLQDGAASPELKKVTMVCGHRGATRSLSAVFSQAKDTRATFEEFLLRADQ
jgi:NAD-dependent SIR2 family protein deacetylase